MKKLISYKIQEGEYKDSIVGIDISTRDYSYKVLHNKITENISNPIRIILDSDEIPSGFVDISTIQNWDNLTQNIANDYLVIKDAIKQILIDKSWDNLTNEEKDLCIKYYALPDFEQPTTYLMTEKGLSEQEANGYILENWHNHHGKLLEVCKQRWYYVKLKVAQYLNFYDAEELMELASPLIFNFIESGRFGKEFGDQRSGILDFIISKHDFESQGLEEQGYILNFGTYEIFINELVNVILHGIYDKKEF